MDTSWLHAGGWAVAAACAAFLGGLSTLEAEPEGDSLWTTQSEQCVTVGTLEQYGYSTLLASTDSSPFNRATSGFGASRRKGDRREKAAPCGTDSARDAARNLCFEAAGAPASVRPEMIARSKALHTSKDVLETVRRAIGPDSPSDWPTGETPTVQIDPPAAPDGEPNSKLSCTANPDTCRGLPPLPPEISAESSPVFTQIRTSKPDVPTIVFPDDERLAPYTSDIGPAPGYQSPPDKPPRRARSRG